MCLDSTFATITVSFAASNLLLLDFLFFLIFFCIILLMDSGNSGSMQSSSGGDEDFDSRGESISSFLNPSTHFASSLNNNINNNNSSNPNPPYNNLTHQNPSFFDPSSHSLDHAFPQSNTHYNNDVNNDLFWSRPGLRSEPMFTNFANPSTTQSGAPFPIPSSTLSTRTDTETHTTRATPKNPKKRTRASRRAPTTVLTTDTANFRQMVQEFTGIPAAPFSNSPYSRRLDLFSAASALRAGAHLENLAPMYPLRPSAHKVLSPFSTSSPALLNSNTIDAIATTTTTTHSHGASTSNNYPLISSDNHLLNLQQHHNGTTSIDKIDHQLRGNVSMNFENLSGLPTLTPATVRSDNNHDDNLSRWKSGETVRSNDVVHENVMVRFDGNIDRNDTQQQLISGYNLNLSEKGLENVNGVSSGAEGNVASWICPSD